MKLDLQIGTSVHCKDKQCGKLAHVVVDPDPRLVLALIVEQGLLLKDARVVPVSAVARATHQAIVLNLFSDDLNLCEQYREVVVKEPAPDVNVTHHSPQLGPSFGPITKEAAVPGIRKRLRQGVAAGQAIFGHKTEIENANGVIGHVDHVIVERESGQIAGIIMRQGSVFPTYHLILKEKVEEIHEEYIQVSLSDAELAILPRYAPRSDAEILADVCEVLLSERTPVFHSIDPFVESGVVCLAGCVASQTVKLHAEELAYLVPGVIDVQNDLVVSSTKTPMAAKEKDPLTIRV